TFSAPDDALGDDLKLHLPAGEPGKRWRNLLNDCQILLHNHPINAMRNSRGAAAVNSLWFWGAGVLPSDVRSHVTNVVSDDPTVAALANMAGIKVTASEPCWHYVASASQAIDLRTTPSSGLESQWLQPLDVALRHGEIALIDIALRSGERLRVKARHRWRFWRRTPDARQ
ncbi:MAG: phosphoglycerate mutase, partial [Dokdonella sp.]